MKKITISIFEQIGSNSAVSSGDGELLYERIIKGLKEQDVRFVLDFTNIVHITTNFLSAAIGQLYGEYKSPFLRDRLELNNMSDEDLYKLKEVVERAKEYFNNKKRMDASIKEALGDE